MTNATKLQLAAAAALIAAAPVAASADELAFSQNAPVAVQNISDTENQITLPYGSRNLYLHATNVGFVNGGNVAATNVRFAIARDGKTQLVDAHGTFAPGTRIDREIANDTSTLPEAAANVTVARIDFADGSVWTPAAGRVAAR